MVLLICLFKKVSWCALFAEQNNDHLHIWQGCLLCQSLLVTYAALSIYVYRHVMEMYKVFTCTEALSYLGLSHWLLCILFCVCESTGFLFVVSCRKNKDAWISAICSDFGRWFLLSKLLCLRNILSIISIFKTFHLSFSRGRMHENHNKHLRLRM